MPASNSKQIVIKGIREGLSVTLPGDGAWNEALAALETRLTSSPAFFKGGRVVLGVGTRALTEDDMRRARDLLARHDVTLLTIASDNEQTCTHAAVLGFDVPPQPQTPARPAQPRNWEIVVEGERQVVPMPPEELPDGGLVVRRTLRSGQSLRHPGSIAVIGDVNPGAEIIAGGDILVWGRLRGTVHAGALGNDGAIVCALDLAPTQLRIGGHITRSPDDRRRKAQPEAARVRDGHIIAEPWGV